MSRLYQIFFICTFTYLLWKCYSTSLLLTMCEEVLRVDFQEIELPPKKRNSITEEVINYCAGDDAAECVPPLYPFRQKYRVADKYHLVGCAIEKNFSTMLTAILCFLFDEQRFLQSSRNLTGEVYHERYCADLNEYDSISSLRSKFGDGLADWSKVTVVRDPLERFVSGFTDKCLREQVWKKFPTRCNQCKRNLSCFMERQYERMMRWTTNFKNEEPPNFDDDHFFPQNWRCEFHSHLHDYHILHYDTFGSSNFIENLSFILRRSNVSERANDFIRTSLASARTVHSTKGSVERTRTKEALLSNKYLVELFIKMYYFDFVLFGYSIPRSLGG